MKHRIALILLLALMTGCSAEPAIVPTTSPAPTLTPSPIPPMATFTPTLIPPQHRIGIRVVDGAGEFYDRMTGEKFIPRGNNYVRLSSRPHCLNAGTIYHSNFTPGEYDPARTESALAQMKADGYNTVRIFIDEWCVVEPDGRLSEDYLDGVAVFLQSAASNDIYVFMNGFPPIPGYAQRIPPSYSNFDWPNVNYLTSEGIQIEIDFWQDFIRGLMQRAAPLENVLGYELRNETFFDGDRRPFTLSSGNVITANGNTYDMSSAQEKQRMMDENLVNWIDRIRAGIQEVDPTSLVAVGFFEPQGPNPSRLGDTRLIRTYPAIWESSADFIDLHAYPGVNLTLPHYMENFELGNFVQKPVIMGEFGAFKSSFPNASSAAQALHDWQVKSCEYGFDGWLLWTWDTDEQPELWNGLNDGGVINGALSPKTRPDPCTPGSFAGQNIALGKPVTASRSLLSNPASMAVDGLFGNWWGAGAFAQQWIEIDLQAPFTISQIRLVTSQSPAGETIHRVRGRSAAGNFQQLVEFRGVTDDVQFLEYSPAEPWEGIQIIRIETLSSPSWVSWREIEIIVGK